MPPPICNTTQQSENKTGQSYLWLYTSGICKKAKIGQAVSYS